MAAIIVSLSPGLTVDFGWILLPQERLFRRGILGVVVGFAGVVLVVRPSPETLFDPTVVGNVLIVLAAVLITPGTVLVRRLHAAMAIPALTGWSMLLGASIQLTFSVLVGEPISRVEVTTTALVAVVYLGIFAGALAFGMYFTLLDSIGALRANLVTYLNPVVALITGLILLGEQVQPVTLLGFAVIAVGFALFEERELVAELARYRGAAR